jgi:hypothetical protein
MLVDHRIMAATRYLPMYSTLGLLPLLVLRADALNICWGFQTSKVISPWWSVRQNLLWTRPANLMIWWNRYPFLRIKCWVWWPKFRIWRSVIPFLLILSNQLVSNWSVSFLHIFSTFLLLLLFWYSDEFAPSRYLLTSRWWRPSSYRANRGFGKSIARYDFFVGWPVVPQRCCSPTGSCLTHWEAVDGCHRSLMTMYSVMLPRNPSPGNFKQLLDAFQSSQRIHRLIELNLVGSANFALGWIRKWHPRLNYSSMSLSFPPGGVKLWVHMDATLQPARRIIARLLREYAGFFREHHYLNPLGVDDSDQPML